MRFKALYILIFIFISISPLSLSAQTHRHEELIIELKEGTDIRAFSLKYAFFNNLNTQLQFKQNLVPGMNYWLLEFDKSVDNALFLNLLKQDEQVKTVQTNKFITLRSTIPNDPQYPTQWQYNNTGQGGGLVGMDLDADLAWDISTGGLTAANDTIVIAVIDDGANINHPDLIHNLWKNRAEIPNNNIDDDGNGYTDDFDGWNSNTNDDNVENNGAGPHGTPVAGIIGAKGNNNLGVSGVNWHVKIMLIRNNFNTTEANVLASYGYALNQRKKYNATNGREGAFVVATNASWGVDNSFPAQAPIWCAFYDTLGKYGILNVASTTNNNVNVDVVGDLPTSCPSDYLISVTNLNRFGTRNGGYGPQNIDLGAFGDGVFTLSFNNYATFGGTSAAAPHVTGTVALAYAAACGEFISLSRLYPGQAALLVKNAIINGSVPNTALNSLTLSGGQLNIFNTLLEIQNACPLDSCFAPYGLKIYALSDSNAIIDWAGGHDSTCLRIRYAGSMNWLDSVVTDQYSYVYNNLSRCKTYEVFVSGWCNGTLGNTEIISFQTEGCCSSPISINQLSSTDFSAQLSWVGPPTANTYQLRWRVYGQAAWNFSNSNSNTYQFINLNPCSVYELQIRTDCGDTIGGYSNSFIFSTTGCNSCGQNTYCSMTGNVTDFDWIESFRFGNYLNISGKSNGYAFYDTIVQTVSAGQTIDFTLEQGNDFLEAVRIWIDYNRDYDFNDADEKVFEGMLNFTDSINGLINIPPYISPAVTRIRVALQWSTYPTLCTQYQNGETEDYCIRILPGTAVNNIDKTLNPIIFPNPANDIISIFNISNDIELIKIVDINGKIISEIKPDNSDSINTKMPDGIASGIYFIQFVSNKKYETLKLIYNR